MDSKSQELLSSKSQEVFLHRGKPYMRQVLLADANVPHKFTIDRNRNKLFFCINADEFSDQSFQSVVLDLDTGVPWVIHGIRNGFASAVDPYTGTVYLGGSNGILKYNYQTSAAQGLLLRGVDIFDMFFKNELYFVDTANQVLSVVRNNNKVPVTVLKNHLIQHFVIDGKEDMYFVNSAGLFVLPFGGQTPTCFPGSEDVNFRGAAVDIYGRAHFVAEEGIFQVDKKTKQLRKWLSINDGYGLAFDKHNNIIYSNARSIIKIYPLKCTTENDNTYYECDE